MNRTLPRTRHPNPRNDRIFKHSFGNHSDLLAEPLIEQTIQITGFAKLSEAEPICPIIDSAR
jgi:hypothetical protein